MGWEGWFTLAVVALTFALLASNRVAPDMAMMAGVTLLIVSGVLTPGEALDGLANEGMVTVGVLYVVVAGMRETGGIAWLVQTVLGRPRSERHAQAKLMVPVALVSAFLNNTPVVAMFIPAAQDWAKRNGISVSKLMIPLSYAAIAGGACTLIGTSTNLVVNGLLIAETDLLELGMFEIAWLGVPSTVLVIAFVLAFSRWLLPVRRPAIAYFENARHYTVEMLVDADSPLAGKSVEQAGLRHLPGSYLVEIDRDGHVVPAVSPQERLQPNDRLVFAGVADAVIDLQQIRGLKVATDQVFKVDAPNSDRCLIEAVVSHSCPLVGQSVRGGRFRTLYNAAVIAVARSGEQLRGKIGDIVLRPGDTLLLESTPAFIHQQRNSRDFFLVSRLHPSGTPRHDRAWIAAAILGGMVAVVTAGWLSMLEAALLAALAMILTRCVSTRLARRAIDWQVLVMIAASFGIANGLEKTGAARAVAETLIGLGGGDPLSSLAVVFVVTAVITAVATNVAAAVLMFPIALATASDLGVDFLPFAMTIMLAASASFATPIGYQTNLMVYGVGGYRFSDYLRMGLPLTVGVGLVAVLVAPRVWPF